MRKFIFGTTFLLLAPFGFIFLLIAVLFTYQLPTTSQSSSAVTAMGYVGNTVAFAALPTSQDIQASDVTQADGRAAKIQQFLETYNSPLAPYANDIVKAADEYGIDYRLLASIAMQESGLCKTIPENSYNCWGFGVTGGTAIHFSSYQDGIYTVSKALGEKYKANGLVTPQQIMHVYTPESNGSWANGVNYFMNQLQ
jgi:hypothetical protein